MDGHVSTLAPCRNEHRWQIPLPWKQKAYSINNDAWQRGRPVIFIAWRIEWGCFFLRIGKAHWWDK